MPVHVLNSETIGKIAAGEVVERPSSVVKELLENALDAGARRIDITVAEGGTALIEVADDGVGMSPDEVALAVQRHATSKLNSFDDLAHIKTLGFRGEALPSIGAVSDLRIRTSRRSSATGSELRVVYGSVTGPSAVAASTGTVVTARDLFGNVPARRKFLRQPGTETGYIARIVGAYAAAYPGVQVSLVADGRRGIATDGSSVDLAAAVGVFGAELASEALVLPPLDRDVAVPGVAVSGWVSSPRVTRSHRGTMHFFVNGRLIQHRALGFALEEAFHSLLMVGRHPLAVVRIQLDPALVDVNVHPTKAEVKFVDERAVCRAVQRATHAALLQQPQDILPEVRFSPPEPDNAWARQADLMNGRDGDHVGSALPAQSDTEAPLRPRSGVPVLRVLGQVGGTYIIAEGPSGMFLIDQHAAHERVLYEQIRGQIGEHGGDRQPLLDPLVVDLPPDELAVFDRSSDELRQIGFEIERFGDGAVAIRAKPAVIANVDLAERLHLILRELADGGAGDSWLDSVAISAACHTSIRAGQALSLPEMRELVTQLERTEQPRACGHGRPTMLHMSRTELERQFSRR